MSSNFVSISKMGRRCESMSGLLRSLAHPGRLMILGHLCNGEKTVSELVLASGVSQSQLSQFLIRMKLEGLVVCERRGRYQFYAIAEPKIRALIRALQKIFC